LTRGSKGTRTNREHIIDDAIWNMERFMKRYIEDILAVLALLAFGYVALLWGTIGQALSG